MYVAQEHSIYGSSRVGVDNRKDTLYKAGNYSPAWGGANTSRRDLGSKSFELSNHLGNVLVTVSDKPVYKVSSTTIFFNPEINSASDYYPFGAPINGRSFSSTEYRFGFNGKEIDGESETQDYGMRINDCRLGRFLSVDPLAKEYAFYSTYHFAGNTPIAAIDLDGEEPKIVVTDHITGYTNTKVYGVGDVCETVVATYETIIQYTDAKGVTTEIAKFNITRDGWFRVGTDAKGNTMLCNRSSDPAPGAGEIYINHSNPVQYGDCTPSFTMNPILSPIDKDCNLYAYGNGRILGQLEADYIRNDYAKGSQFHVGGVYEDENCEKQLAGTYGCYGIVDPSQLSQKPNIKPPESEITSNYEMQRFGNAIQTAQSMDLEEHKNKSYSRVEVQIQPRTYDKTKTIPK
jgi:RHS repeat-associated protein